MEPSLFRFLSILGHELRNPLAAISNALHLISRRNAGDPALERSCELIGRQVRHLVRLTDDLLDLARIGEGRLEIHKARLDLAELVRAAADDHRAAAESAQLTLHLELPEAPVWVEGDPARLTQAVSHLVNNAIRFTGPGGQVTASVGVGSWAGSREAGGGVGGGATSDGLDESDGSDAAPPPALPAPAQPPTSNVPAAVLTVRDNGAGIAPELLPQLFDPLVRADESQSSSGLGLGLALVKGRVELHGGRVQAASDGPGRGTAFTVWLPLAVDRRG